MIYAIAGIAILALAIAACVLVCVSDLPPEYRDPTDTGDVDEHADIGDTSAPSARPGPPNQ